MAWRYAIYAAPRPQSALWRVANSWLGRDPETGAAISRPRLAGFSAERCAEITEAPRHYGFHATLKPPFRMAPGMDEKDLLSALAAFAKGREAIVIPPLEVTTLGGFLALTCVRDSPELDSLAAACVREFDNYRATMSPEGQSRRWLTGLPPAQGRNLAARGYPFVLDEFRFHMTLTDRLAAQERARVADGLNALFATSGLDRVILDGIYLFEQTGADEPFLLTQWFDFA